MRKIALQILVLTLLFVGMVLFPASAQAQYGSRFFTNDLIFNAGITPLVDPYAVPGVPAFAPAVIGFNAFGPAVGYGGFAPAFGFNTGFGIRSNFGYGFNNRFNGFGFNNGFHGGFARNNINFNFRFGNRRFR